jgi:tetratricopeptide (TPR) repeat protein
MKCCNNLLIIAISIFAFTLGAYAQAEPKAVPAATPIVIMSEEGWCNKFYNEGKYDEAWPHCAGSFGSLLYTFGKTENRVSLQANQESRIERLAVILSKLSKTPTIPDDAVLHAQKGIGFTQAAKSPADFAKAIKEFQYALNSAPWVFDYYFNLASVFNAAGQFKDALNILALAKILAANDEDRKDVISLRAKIEVAQEMAPK